MKFTKIVTFGLTLMAVLIIGSSVVGIIGNKTVSKQYKDLLEHEIELEHVSMRLNEQMLLARRHEKDFLMRLDKKYLTRHKEAVENIIEYAHQIDEQTSKLGEEFKHARDDADSIMVFAENYEKAFLEVVKSKELKGFTHNEGLQGNFRKSAHSLMDIVDELKLRDLLPTIGEDLLTVRRHEKDYLLRHDEKYAKRVHAKLDNIKSMVTPVLKPDDSKRFNTTIDNYYLYFDGLVNENKKVVSLIKEMRASVHKIEPAVEDLNVIADESLQKKIALALAKARFSFLFITIIAIIGISVSIFVTVKLLTIVKDKLGAEPDVLEKLTKEISRGNIHLNFEEYDSFGEHGLYKDMKNMANEIKISVSLAEEIADGNISVESHLASDDDALGHALDKMTDSLNNVVAGIKNAADRLDENSGQISDASQVIAESATEQAATIEEISASMVEIGKSATTNAENAQGAQTFAGDAEHAAQKGATDMENLRKTMDEVVDSSQQVVKIIKVIDDIAFQTNLLALNAAVEAARAGKHGKGFAVVADEVRNLAARSAKAAQETATLITASNDGAARGADMTSRTAEAFATIVEQVTGMGTLIQSIATGAVEQEVAVKEINSGLEQLGRAIQNNSATSEETAASSEEMSAQAADLNRLIRFFKVNSMNPVNPGSGVDQVELPDAPVLSYDQAPIEY